MRTHRILWGEGVFLRPQHFQQQERFFEARIARCLAGQHAHPWGVEAVELDREALAGGLLNLARLDLVFSDGSCFEAPAQEPLPAARRLDDLADLGLNPLVYACLPLLGAFGGNCAGLGDSAGRPVRFSMERVQLADLFTAALETEVTVLRAQESVDGVAVHPTNLEEIFVAYMQGSAGASESNLQEIEHAKTS